MLHAASGLCSSCNNGHADCTGVKAWSSSETLVSTNTCLEVIRPQKTVSKRGNVLQTPIFLSWSRCSSVGIVTLLWAALTSNRGLAPKGDRELFSRQQCQHQLWDRLILLSMGNGGYLIEAKWPKRETNHSHSV